MGYLHVPQAPGPQVNTKVMKDPMMANFDPKTLPFDGKRMLAALSNW
jgi:uncharacterized protein YbaA (DUF1428 family)